MEDTTALGQWLNKPRLFGISIRNGFWVFHVIAGLILIWGVVSYIKSPNIQIAALIFGVICVVLGVVALFRVAPDFSEIITGFTLITLIGTVFNFDRIDALKEVASTIGNGASDAYESAATEAAGFSFGSSTKTQSTTTPQQSKAQPANAGTNWWVYAKNNGYVSTGKRLSANELAWCEAEKGNLNEHNRVNCGTKTIMKCVSCNRGAK